MAPARLAAAVFATAPMNGYASLAASIIDNGFPRSIRAATPVGIFFDLAVVAAAPVRLIRAGLGDSLCRSTAQADWLLAHLLLDRPYREAPFALLADDEAALVAQPRGLVSGDLDAMRHLVRTLVLSGFGMTICGGSFPASQGEHLIGHYIAMTRTTGIPETFHGEQIAVATVAMSRLQDQILALEAAPVLHPTAIDRDAIIRRFGPVQGDACWREFELKRLDRAATDAVNARLARDWSAIRDRIDDLTLSAARISEVLTMAGAPNEPAELGWPPALFDEHSRRSQMRNAHGHAGGGHDSRSPDQAWWSESMTRR